jgi:hypothetical protein
MPMSPGSEVHYDLASECQEVISPRQPFRLSARGVACERVIPGRCSGAEQGSQSFVNGYGQK